MKITRNAKMFAKGAVVGGSMLLPGLSGGTIAILLGIYEKLIKAVSDITKGKKIKNNLLFLGVFTLGGLGGVLCFSYILSAVLFLWGYYLSFLFMGAVIGTVPVIFLQSGANRLNARDVFYTSVGVALSVSLTFIPENLLSTADNKTVSEFILLFMAGVFVAVALILPGISVSYTLLILGLYERTVEAVKSFDIVYVLPLGVGCVAGILAFTRFLDYLMTRHTRGIYMVISGFVISCVPTVYPGHPQGTEYLIAIPLLIIGFFAVYLIAGKAQKSSG